MPGTTTSSAIAHIESTPVAHPHHLRAVAPRTAAPADDAPMTDAELMRHNVEALCSHMLWLRAWWEGHEQAIRAADRRAAACIHDHFIDGAGFARSIVRQEGFETDEQRMRNYSWGRSMQTVRMIEGAQ
ncbi:hypothetical protein GJ698_02905 [Pseudoduganella sp. FT26W]|uniref:Uncharacterized protein n=1 Tax=Duganella aquatilis TaxID=2666082 RepID=A0A844D738_9BURK|nr:hypothetical protein [Duganella aquatilis]MRW83039.1 hypothetical protein [Duganella aquatilis]